MLKTASFGREKIKVSLDHVGADNVLSVLSKTLPIHMDNSQECDHLFDVYRGKQAVLGRIKSARPEINNKLIVNHANEIVSFKTSYLLSEPIVYVSRGTASSSDEVNVLNEMMYLNNKAARDKEIADDFGVCGVAYRMALPNPAADEIDEPPFVIYTLDPRYTYVVYSSALGEKPLCSVQYVSDELPVTDVYSSLVFSVYTDKEYFEIKNGKIISQKPHALGMVPVIEYVNSNSRLGAFEPVETLLDAINTLASNRVDATEQAVQALTVFYNCDISSEDFQELRHQCALKIKSAEGTQSKVDVLSMDFNQADQQVLMDALYDEILRITGMPSQAMGNTSDSSNNGAVIVRNGWYNAEARAKDTELLWRESEGHFLRLVLKICRDSGALNLRLADFTPKFTRRNYEDLMVRSQVLTTMLANEKIAPRLAFAHCGMFVDAEEAYAESMEWYEENRQKAEELAAAQTPVQIGGTEPVDEPEPIEPGE